MGNSQKWLNISAVIFMVALAPFAGVGLAKILNIRGGNYTVQCAVVTPSGPVPTVSLKGKDVVITDFGIVKMKEGLYIPTVSEICLIKKELEQ